MQCCFAVSSADRFIQDTIVRNVNDEMIADSSMKNNKSISRSMIVMGTMFKNAKPELQYTYGAQPLLNLTNLLRHEVRCYLECKAIEDPDRPLARPLQEKEKKFEESMQKYIRGMKRDEVRYFEDPRGLWYCFEFMLEQLVSCHEKAITAKTYYSFIDWSTKDTQYGNVQDLKDKTKTGKLESTLVTLHWLFDFLDFVFEDLVRAEKVPE